MTAKIVSFDIFDTCLIRTCGTPTRVFDILARQILADTSDTSCQMDFALVRKTGEITARQKANSKNIEEVSLKDIYDECDFSLYTDLGKEEIMQTELDIEKNVLVSVQSIKEKIRDERAKGASILFISDMYLPYEFIVEVLKKQNIFEEGDYCFVSNNNNKTKSTGTLFTYVKEQLHLDPKHWTHYGDNKHSDYLVPKKLGISSVLINHQFSYYEKLMMKNDYSNTNFPGHHLAAISKSILLSSSSLSVYKRVAADLIAPLYVTFVYSVLQDATNRGINRIFFLARDGYIFYKIAQVLSDVFPHLELRYLYVSRKSLYLPSLNSISTSEFKSMFYTCDYMDIDDILEQFQMEDTDTSQFEKKQGYGITQLEQLLDDKIFYKTFYNRFSNQKELTLKYFIQEGLCGNNTAIVDLTGTRRCHQAINRIISKTKAQVFGYYFEVFGERILGKDYFSLNYRERYAENRRNNRLEPHDIFEQYFSITNQERTASYCIDEGIIKPVFEEDPVDIEYKNTVFSTNVKICQEYAKHLKNQQPYFDMKQANQLALSIVSAFLYVPHKDYIKAFDGLLFSNGKNKTEKLLDKTILFKIIKNRKQHPWLEGMLMYNSICPHLLMKLLNYRYSRK